MFYSAYSIDKCNTKANVGRKIQKRGDGLIFFQGLWFSLCFIIAICLDVISMKEECFGRYCRMSAFRYSMCGLSVEVYGLAKYTGTLRRFLILSKAINSGPLSVVIECSCPLRLR